MSLKFDYLLTILKKLDMGECVSNRSIMDDLEVSERSAYRYIESLMMAGFPVWYDRKRKSYAFTEGFKLLDQNASAEEKLALYLARTFLFPLGGKVASGIDSLTKRISGRQETSVPSQIFIPDHCISPEIQQKIADLHHAITNHMVVEITYPSSTIPSSTSRSIDPLYLFFTEGFWYLRGLCHQADALRSFSIDRIISLKVTSEQFRPYDISGDEELSTSFGANLDGDPTNIVLRFEAEYASQILRRKWHPSQTETVLPGGNLEVKFNVNGINGIKPWIYRWLPGVEVMEPAELREMIFEELTQAMSKHERKPTELIKLKDVGP